MKPSAGHPEPDAPWSPPAQVGDFDLGRPLGHGGMGMVYLANDRVLHRQVALKFISGAVNDTRRARFLAEARALARLHHPNVVQVFQVGSVSERPYLAYEYVSGATLAELVSTLPFPRVLSIAVGLARGLAAVHRRGILHRDVKPANVILGSGDEPKLIDLGLARAAAEVDPEEAEGAALAQSAPSMTRTGSIVGTPRYMAPELFEGATATVASDVFSLGLVLYELAAGRVLFADMDELERLERLRRGHIPKLPKECPASFAELVMRCLAGEPAARPRTMDEVRDTLELLATYYRPLGQLEVEDEVQTRALVAASFERISADADAFADDLYQRLFAIAPQLRELFPPDLTQQRAKLMGALRVAVAQLDNATSLIDILEGLGRRHHGYGVTREHFEFVGKAMLGAIEAYEGELFTAEIGTAWTRVYERISQAMIRGLEAEGMSDASTVATVPPPPRASAFPKSPSVPQTRFVTRGDISLAYQIVGDGPVDIAIVPDFASHIEVAWSYPPFARFVGKLAAGARVILYDKRGVGLSDRTRATVSLGEHVDDVISVLDACESPRALLFGDGAGSAIALATGALRPERVRGIMAWGACGQPFDIDARLGHVQDRLRSGWGGPVLAEAVAPSVAAEQSFRDFWASYVRSGTSLAATLAELRMNTRVDLRPILRHVAAPTLFLHRSDDLFVSAGAAVESAASIPGATLQAIAGADHLPYVGDSDAVVEEVERFAAAAEGEPSRALTPFVRSSGGMDEALARHCGGIVLSPNHTLFERLGDAATFALTLTAQLPDVCAFVGACSASLRWDSDPIEAIDAWTRDWPDPPPGQVVMAPLAHLLTIGSSLRVGLPDTRGFVALLGDASRDLGG